MAEEKQGTEAAEDTRDEGGSKLMGILLVAVGLLVGGAVGTTAVGPAVGSLLADRAEKKQEEEKNMEEKASEAVIVSFDNVVANPAGSGGSRFLVLSLALELEAGLDAEIVEAREPEIRDGLLRLLGSKTVDELARIEERDRLTEEMREVIEEIVGADTIGRIYLPHYVIQ